VLDPQQVADLEDAVLALGDARPDSAPVARLLELVSAPPNGGAVNRPLVNEPRKERA
jgi:hypothetical protein